MMEANDFFATEHTEHTENTGRKDSRIHTNDKELIREDS